MNNFKKVALSLLVAGLAVGFSAFRTSDKKADALANTYYILSSNTNYQKVSGSQMPNLEGCRETADHPCVISFASDPGPSNLNPTSLPATPNFQSSEKGVWAP
ncbi:hypothetical protein MUB18_20685 [Sphingobacterium sp. PCS056]|uniref:hypothetical protein n=1 Tax=Sphingobacterium sp. PCS056 TaxID=2931400 RepID=UPI00200DC299|nr:hypothetical protein [Sphingobacterium sp. PCS056]UPZ36506.1 hypothetical protein MUB18_20685 [Sphingobacterium sp. PCS056]